MNRLTRHNTGTTGSHVPPLLVVWHLQCLFEVQAEAGGETAHKRAQQQHNDPAHQHKAARIDSSGAGEWNELGRGQLRDNCFRLDTVHLPGLHCVTHGRGPAA